MKKILAVISVNPDYIQFAIPQLKSLLRNLDIPFSTLFSQYQPLPPYQYLINNHTFKTFPYIILNVPNFNQNRDYFNKIGRKAVMISKFILLISSGSNYQQLINNRDEEILKTQCRNWQDIVACDFQSRNRTVPRQYQIKQIHTIFQQMDVRGKIDIKSAPKRFQVVEDHKWYQGHHQTNIQDTLEKVYFGVQLCNYKQGNTKFNAKFQLSKRIYLGPTSTDNDLAFMMCNQANIGSGSLVLDPFVGTGGLLIPPASLGAITFGSDLDIRVLNGYSVGRINKKSPYYNIDKKLQIFTPKIFLNFDQYGFIRPNIFRMDCVNPSFRTQQFLDAIICDPPYGLRAMSRTVNKVGQVKEQQIKYNEEEQENQSKSDKQENKIQQSTQLTAEEKLIQEQLTLKKKLKRVQKKQNRKKRNQELTQQQKIFKKDIVKRLNDQRVKSWQRYDKNKIQTAQRQKIFQGLLILARKYLKPKGRLVFLYPISQQDKFSGPQSLPPYEGFSLIDISENKLSMGNSRILVTLQKNSILSKNTQ